MGEFRMPSLGAEMTEGKLVEWLITPGTEVHRGDVVAVVETDKAALEVEIWEDGVVEELLIGEGVKVPVGTPLARLGASNGAAAPPRVEAAPAVAEPPTAVTLDEPLPPVRGPLARHRAEALGVDLRGVQGTAPGGAITRHDIEEAARTPSRDRISPYARRLAERAGLDPTTIHGSGPGGAVVARDLDGAPPVSTPDADPHAAMRAAVARAMTRSKREIPHYYLGTRVDLTDTLTWLAERNAAVPPSARILPAVLQLKAVALALRDHPELNGYLVNDRFTPGASIDVGVAIALRGGGLVAPALHAADERSVDELMASLHDLVRRARAGRLRVSEATGATVTVTNLGDLGVETVYGVIYPPQVALIGFGRVQERPWVVDGQLRVRQVVHLTLAADHRQTDGQLGARYLTTVAELLQRPHEL